MKHIGAIRFLQLCNEEAVNRLQQLAGHLACLVLAGFAAPAFAGELGLKSRDTVTISISIPPHVMAGRLDAPKAAGFGAGGDLCVAAGGYENVHLALVRPTGEEMTSARPDETSALKKASSRPACLLGSRPGQRIPLDPASLSVPALGEPMIMLIVAD